MFGCSHPTCQQQPRAIRRSVVGEANSDPIFGQLVRIGCTHNMVSFDFGVGNLEKDKVRSQDSSDTLLHEAAPV